MLKKKFSLISLSLLIGTIFAVATPYTAYAATKVPVTSERGNAVALVALILSLGVIVAFTVMNLKKKKKINNK